MTEEEKQIKYLEKLLKQKETYIMELEKIIEYYKKIIKQLKQTK